VKRLIEAGGPNVLALLLDLTLNDEVFDHPTRLGDILPNVP
jgi:hypothetical protein